MLIILVARYTMGINTLKLFKRNSLDDGRWDIQHTHTLKNVYTKKVKTVQIYLIALLIF